MFVKVLALFLIVGVCLGLPVEDTKKPPADPAPVGFLPPTYRGLPPTPPKQDDSDLKADPSTWWHTYYHQTYPVYYYNTHHVPTYTYWHHAY